MKRLLCAAAAAILFVTPVWAGPEEALFNTANIIYQSAETQTPELQQLSYDSVRQILDQIVTEYPASDLAVRILLEDTINGLDVAAVNTALDETAAQEVIAAPDTALEVAAPESSPEAASNVEDIQTLELAALPMDLVAPAPELPPRSEVEIVTDLQTELNRIGCPAGPADGVVGRKTRSAFSNFIRDSGSELTAEDLVTEAAVAELKEQEGKVCKTRTMATTPASALAGSWGFRSDCPGFGNRIIRNRGTMRLQYTNNRTLRGRATNQQGISGSAVIQFQGSRTAATVIKFGFVTVKGNLIRSTRNMTISGTGALNCKITAWKN